MTIFVNFIKESEDIQTPKYETKGAAGFDLRSAEDIEIPPDSTRCINTGLAFSIPKNYEMQIRSRSGLALNKNVYVKNQPATIDSDFRDYVKIILHNADRWLSFTVNKGDRIAQGIIAPAPIVKFIEVNELDKTERGNNGFGHTGIK